MQTSPFIVLISACLIVSTGRASDVAYKLDDGILTHPEAAISIRPDEFKFVDRAWAVPGIEQSLYELLPPRPFDLAEAKAIERYQNEHPVYISGFKCRMHGPVEGAQWFDEVAWPRTRELCGLGRICEYDNYQENRQEFTFGGVTLQR